jgi:hypothetical protein
MRTDTSPSTTGKSTSTPVLRPIQLRCMVSTRRANRGNAVTAFKQLISIGGNAQKPLLQFFLYYRRRAAPAYPVFDLLIGEHRQHESHQFTSDCLR